MIMLVGILSIMQLFAKLNIFEGRSCFLCIDPLPEGTRIMAMSFMTNLLNNPNQFNIKLH